MQVLVNSVCKCVLKVIMLIVPLDYVQHHVPQVSIKIHQQNNALQCVQQLLISTQIQTQTHASNPAQTATTLTTQCVNVQQCVHLLLPSTPISKLKDVSKPVQTTPTNSQIIPLEDVQMSARKEYIQPTIKQIYLLIIPHGNVQLSVPKQIICIVLNIHLIVLLDYVSLPALWLVLPSTSPKISHNLVY